MKRSIAIKIGENSKNKNVESGREGKRWTHARKAEGNELEIEGERN